MREWDSLIGKYLVIPQTFGRRRGKIVGEPFSGVFAVKIEWGEGVELIRAEAIIEEEVTLYSDRPEDWDTNNRPPSAPAGQERE